MTVKEIVSTIRDAKAIYIAWSGCVRQINPNDTLDMDAYGNYVVGEVLAVAENEFEIGIACRPVKA